MWEPPSSFELGPAVAGWAPHLRAGAQNPPHLLPTKRKGGEETSTAPDPPVCGHSRPTARLRRRYYWSPHFKGKNRRTEVK